MTDKHTSNSGERMFAQDGYIQPMTEAIERLRRRHEFDVEDIESVTVGTHARAVNHVIGLIRDPKDLTDAQFSGNFSVALALITGGAGVREHTEENLNDPRIRALSERVFLEIDDEIKAEFHRTRPRGAQGPYPPQGRVGALRIRAESARAQPQRPGREVQVTGLAGARR